AEGGAEVGGLFLDFVLEAGGFHGPDALLAPVGDGHGFDQGKGRLASGLEALLERGEEGEEVLTVLAGEDDRAREDAVAAAVAGRVAFALRRDGAAGFGAVTASGSDAPRAGAYRRGACAAGAARDALPVGERGVRFAALARGEPGFGGRDGWRLRRVFRLVLWRVRRLGIGVWGLHGFILRGGGSDADSIWL